MSGGSLSLVHARGEVDGAEMEARLRAKGRRRRKWESRSIWPLGYEGQALPL